MERRVPDDRRDDRQSVRRISETLDLVEHEQHRSLAHGVGQQPCRFTMGDPRRERRGRHPFHRRDAARKRRLEVREQAPRRDVAVIQREPRSGRPTRPATSVTAVVFPAPAVPITWTTW